ncbi:zinc ribbon domain-containing protein [Streptomyces sp. NPDC006172]|uniref:NADase-type glycan-binding domain-containing protein n=1 Tax=Streptomyces sp. NPDC006172 TaxID=3154470 RepID=UPI0033CD6A2F
MTTHNCADCGTRAEPGQSFCDACGAVLSWTDRSSPARRTPAAAPAGGGTGAAAEGGTPDAGPGTATAAVTTATGTSTTTAAGATTGTTAGATAATTTAGAPAAVAAPDAAEAGARTASAPAEPSGSADDDVSSDDEDTTETPLPALPPDEPGSQETPSASPTAQPAPATPQPTPAPAPAATPAPAAPQPVPAIPSPAPAPDDTMTARARSLLVPVAEPEPRPVPQPAVAPVLPGRPVVDRPQVRAPGPQQGEMNGVPCPWCATPNNPDRHYCVRCAMPMTLVDDAPARRPWWRRLPGFRSGRTPWAGDRPRLRRTFDRVVTWVVAAAVLSLLVWVGFSTPGWIDATRDHFAKRAPVAPDQITASRSYPGHKPELAFDRLNNSWWGPGVSQSGQGEWIEARFAEPTRLLDLIITPGVSTRGDQLQESALPHRVKATITKKDGTTTTRDLVLDQGAGGQRRAFRVGEVTKVRLTIESAYAASASKQVAIAEVEFFGPSTANAN